MGFIDLEKAYDIVNREALWYVLRIYDVGVIFRLKIRACMLIAQLVSE